MVFSVANNAESTVADNPLSNVATTLNVAAGEGDKFPATFPYRLTMWDKGTYPDSSDDPNMEVVECTARTTDALTIIRGKENTSGTSHALGHTVELLITAGIFNDPEHGILTNIESPITKTSAYTASAFDSILADTDTTAAFTITLPASPNIGNIIQIYDAKGNFAVDNLTIARNGLNIRGVAEDLILDVNWAYVKLVYVDATIGWRY